MDSLSSNLYFIKRTQTALSFISSVDSLFITYLSSNLFISLQQRLGLRFVAQMLGPCRDLQASGVLHQQQPVRGPEALWQGRILVSTTTFCMGRVVRARIEDEGRANIHLFAADEPFWFCSRE